MTLIGGPFLALVATAAVLGVVGAALWLPRTSRTVRGFLARVLTQLGVSLLVVVLVAVVLNDQFTFYTDWGDLLGTNKAAGEQASGGTSPQKALEAKPSGPGLEVARPAQLAPLPSPGQRLQNYSFTGAKSGLKGRILVILPAGYEDPANSARAYPVIETFHGWPGNPEVWTQAMHIGPAIDALTAQRKIADTIVVAPQLEFPSGTDTECVDGGVAGPQVETWVSRDVPDLLASTLRVRTDRASWAAAGFSSGGWCSAMAAMLHPDIYGAGIVLGGYFAPEFGKTYRPFGPADPPAKRYDLLDLAQRNPPPVALWVHTSKSDGLSWASTARLLKDGRQPLSIQSVVVDGAGHRTAVWDDVLPEALTWLGRTVSGFKAP